MRKQFIKLATALLLAAAPALTAFGKDFLSIQADVFGKLPFHSNNGKIHCFGVEAASLLKFHDHIFAKGGLMFDMGKSNYDNMPQYNYHSCTMLEFGIPVMAEVFLGDTKDLNGIYLDLGVIPTFYGTSKVTEYTDQVPDLQIQKNELTSKGFPIDGEKEKGFAIVPRLEIGTYVNMGKLSVKGGVFVQKVSNRSTNSEGEDVYCRSGRSYIGALVGVVF